ncbi:hypothetical protein TRFO_35823 [Tritrichomonas foetus]|uniref:Uncharacterized protein n=1 Tax=Tritrichomonas foetus TaxID=1144522 RepID=A0A1J4JI05_9EUKA|nr:hypothetical protein TRFO_35823 [Tritrichomonas foetus]|eukprot:OHS97887.1 hypothetical protein TRFO_35823 [Tritrichomonas foetus]
MNVDFSSFLYTIIIQLGDPNPDIVQLAKDALIEIGKTSPIKMAEALVKELTGYSSSNNINRVEILKTLHQIIKTNYQQQLISTTCGPIVNLLAFTPPVSSSITDECIEILNTLCDYNNIATSREFRSIPSNSSALVDFFISRTKQRELIFFIQDNRPAMAFNLFVSNIPKTADEKVRVLICQLLCELSDILIDTKTDLKILTEPLLSIIDTMMNSWSKTTPVNAQSSFLTAISAVVSAVDVLTLAPKLDRIVQFFNDAMSIQATRKAAATGISSILSIIERLRDKPKIQAAVSAKCLFDFVDHEYVNIQTDGSIMRAINSAIGGLTTLMTAYPKSPLEVVLKRIPSPASFYALNYFCNSFGDTYATDIGYALASTKFLTLPTDTKALYANCFFTLIKKCQTKVPSFDEALKNIATFVSEQQQSTGAAASRDTILQFTFVTKQFPESFKHVFPKILSVLIMPSLFYATPTLITVAAQNSSFIANNISQIGEANIDNANLLAHLLMFAFSELLTSSTKNELRHVIAAIAEVEYVEETEILVRSILSKHHEKSFHEKLTQSAQKLIDTYVFFGGDKPLFSTTNRGALLAAAATLLGNLLQSEYTVSQIDSVQRSLIARMNPQESLEIAAIAKFIGLTAALKPDNAVNFLRQQMDIIVMNNDNKLKFWKKKEKPLINATACTLAAGELFNYSPSSYSNFGSITMNLNVKFVEMKEVPNWAKMRVIESEFNRNSNDSKFTLTNAKQLATRASLCLQDCKDYASFMASMDALNAACHNNASMIDRADAVITSSLKFQEKGFKINEEADFILHVSKFIKNIVEAKKVNTSSVIMSFHDVISKNLTSVHWQSNVDAMLNVVNAFESVKDANLLKMIPIITTYFVVSNAKASQAAHDIAARLLGFIKPDVEQLAKDATTPPQIAQVLIDLQGETFNHEYVSLLFSTLVHHCHSQLGSASGSILRAFATTTQAERDTALFVKEYLTAVNEASDAIISLFRINKEVVIDALLSEPYSQAISTFTSSLFSNSEIRYDVLSLLLERAAGEFCENALSMLSSVKYSLPYAEKGELITMKLSMISMKLKNPAATTSICDIFSAMMGDKSCFSDVNSIDRKRMTSPTDAHLSLKQVFKVLIDKCGNDNKILYEMCLSYHNDEQYQEDVEVQTVLAVVLGQILGCPRTNHELANEIVELLTEETNNDFILTQRILSLGEVSAYATSSCGDKIIKFALDKVVTAPCQSLLTLQRVSQNLNDEQITKFNLEILDIVEKVIKQDAIKNNTSSLTILTLICSHPALLKDTQTTEKLWNLYPLILCTLFSSDRETAEKAIESINMRIGAPWMNTKVETCEEFAKVNAKSIEMAALAKNASNFTENLCKCTSHSNPKVRATAACIMITLLKQLNGKNPEIDSILKENIEKLMIDADENVRLSVATIFGLPSE